MVGDDMKTQPQRQRPETVSVVTPCYNAAEFLRETIDSVLRQTYGAVEMLVVDDGSTDGSWDIVCSYGDRIRGVRTSHRGGCHALNVGAGLATGQFLLFLGADDLIRDDTIASLVAALGNRASSLAACPWAYWLNHRGQWKKVASGLPPRPPRRDYILGWLTGWYIPTNALLWPREVYEATGGWDEELWANQDGDLMLRALLSGVQIVWAEGGEAYYRKHGSARVSVSASFSDRAMRSRMRVLEKAAAQLRANGQLERYAQAFAMAYHRLARNGFDANEDLARLCVARSVEFGGSKPAWGSWIHRILCRIVGLERKEQVARALARLGLARRKRRIAASLRGPLHHGQ